MFIKEEDVQMSVFETPESSDAANSTTSGAPEEGQTPPSALRANGDVEIQPPSGIGFNHQRQRQHVEVVLPTLAEVLQVKKCLKEDYKKLKKFINPKVKTKANMRLHEDTTLDRLKPIGLELYDITLPRAQMEVTVSRDFMASVYGGSMQATRPKIGKEKLATHPFRNFVYLHMDYQPHAPQVPGAPGLFIGTRVGTDWEGPQKVFVRLASNTYQYEGEYDVRYSTPFTLAEWTNQKYEVKRTWATQICLQKWGTHVRIRVQARKEGGGRNPSKKRLDDVRRSRRFKKTTPDDIMAALNTGQERLTIWTMKCIGYDEAFQLELCDKFPRWVPPVRKPRAKKAPSPDDSDEDSVIEVEPKKKQGKRKAVEVDLTSAAPSRPKKRKVTESSEMDIVGSGSGYTPRGTLSRPKSAKVLQRLDVSRG